MPKLTVTIATDTIEQMAHALLDLAEYDGVSLVISEPKAEITEAVESDHPADVWLSDDRLLERAAEQRASVEFDYESITGHRSHRRVRPVRLTGVSLLAHDLDKDEAPRSFYRSGISNVKLAGR